MFVQASFFLDTTGPGVNALLPLNMWWSQLPIGVLFLLMSVMVVTSTSKVGTGMF